MADAAEPRSKELHWTVASDHFREHRAHGHEILTGRDMGQYVSQETQAHSQTRLLFPLDLPMGWPGYFGMETQVARSSYLHSPDYGGKMHLEALDILGLPWNAKVEAGLSRSPIAKAMDYGTEIQLEITRFFLNHLSITSSVAHNRVSGLGALNHVRVLASYVETGEQGAVTLMAGYWGNFAASGRAEFESSWLSFSQDLFFENGTDLVAGLSASMLRSRSFENRVSSPLIMAEDIRAPQTGADFQSPGYLDLAIRESQDFIALNPFAGHGISLPWDWRADIGADYTLSVYPKRNSWYMAPLEGDFDPGQADFQGLVFNKADGRYYSAARLAGDGGDYREIYGATPLEYREVMRIDNRFGGSLGLRKNFPSGQTLSLQGWAAKTISNMPGNAPIAIPAWEGGLGFQWARNWEWL